MAEFVGRNRDGVKVKSLLLHLQALQGFEPGPSGAAGRRPDTSARAFTHLCRQIQYGDVEALREALSQNPVSSVRRAAMVALDQMPTSSIESNHVIPLLDSPDPILRNTATWIVSHRPAWGADWWIISSGPVGAA